ncbi:2981_t:CDS:1, partial [Acaulospora colombiana]
NPKVTHLLIPKCIYLPKSIDFEDRVSRGRSGSAQTATTGRVPDKDAKNVTQVEK